MIKAKKIGYLKNRRPGAVVLYKNIGKEPLKANIFAIAYKRAIEARRGVVR